MKTAKRNVATNEVPEPKRTVTFAFEPNQAVLIKASGVRGKVRGLYLDRDGIKSAYVEYFSGTNQKLTDYFRENEITAIS